jgi:DnaJ-class molecular chaperone
VKRFDEIDAARKLLLLPEQATLEEIRAHFRDCLREWHPDKSNHSVEQCTEMTAKIVTAYRTLVDYCHRYKYSFSIDSVKEHLSEEEWWMERFGRDSVWGRDPESS